MKIRCKDPSSGQQHTLTLEDHQTFQDLLNIIASTVKQPASSISRIFMLPAWRNLRLTCALIVRNGVPPHAEINASNPRASLKELGIKHGDSFLIKYGTPTPSTSAPQQQRSPKLVKVPIADDNSCLFNSIGYVLLGRDKTQSGFLRNLVVETINGKPAEFNEAMLGMPAGRYCSKILSPEVWGGAIELSIFAKYFQTEIVAIDVENVVPMVFGEGAGYKKRVYVLYSGIHYDAIAMQSPMNTDIIQTVFDSTDDILFGQALAIAEDDRKHHRFTNTNNFLLKCGVCKIAIKGQAEAQDHAAKTGHSSFEEY